MKKRFARPYTFIIPMGIFLITVILMHSVFLIALVPSVSMEPTLKCKSLVLGFRIYEELDRGDIIVFKHEGTLFVKRIAAMEGDIVVHKGERKVVPERSVYVLGDNEKHSFDSRYWDNPFVPLNQVVAKVVMWTTDS